MTIGFASTHLNPGEAAFLLVADCRFSAAGETATDRGLKTLSSGRQTGAVAAGHVLTMSTAAEMTRGIVDDHDRNTEANPAGFFETVRLFSYFLNDLSKGSNNRACEVVIAGFLRNGNPALAKVITRVGRPTLATLYTHRQRGALISFIGEPIAKVPLMNAIRSGFDRGSLHWVKYATGAIWHLSQDPRRRGIGGAPSVAICGSGGHLYWPFVELAGRLYLRGFDVTDARADIFGDIFTVPYDRQWHSDIGKMAAPPEARGPGVAPSQASAILAMEYKVENWVRTATLLRSGPEPEELQAAPQLDGPAAIIEVLHTKEIPAEPY